MSWKRCNTCNLMAEDPEDKLTLCPWGCSGWMLRAKGPSNLSQTAQEDMHFLYFMRCVDRSIESLQKVRNSTFTEIVKNYGYALTADYELGQAYNAWQTLCRDARANREELTR